MKKILSTMLSALFLLSACAAPQSVYYHEENSWVYDSISGSEITTETAFFMDSTIEIIASDTPFSDYQIPNVASDEFESYIERLLEQKTVVTDLEVFCDFFEAKVVKKYCTNFYGDTYCTVVKTDDSLRFCSFAGDGKDIWTFYPVTQSETITKDMFDHIKVGNSVDSVKQIDADAVYHESYGSMGYPPTSTHYTVDSYLIYIEYDRKWNIVDIVTMAI